MADCRALCEREGWPIGAEYVDNDISAYSGKRRPAFERMLEDLAERRRDGVVVYHQDRLTRRPAELERFLDVLAVARVGVVRFVSGPAVDATNGDGLLVLRIIGAVAAGESDTKSRRVKRKMAEIAASGRPHGTGNRPFGYERDGITMREDEAAVIRHLAARYLAGDSTRSMATWLDEHAVRTVHGEPWRTPTLRAMLSSGRIAGLREHNGEVVATAVWPAIITVAQHERLRARFAEKAVTGRRTPRRYLLSGLLRCGRCGNKLFSSSRVNSRRYVCKAGPDHHGCGRLTVVAEPLETLLTEAVLLRLDTPELAHALAGQYAEDHTATVQADSLDEDRAMLDELATVYAAKAITMNEWLTARKDIEIRMLDTQARLARTSRSDSLVGFLGGAGLRERWAAQNLQRQHAILKAVIDHVRIDPKQLAATHSLDPGRVHVTWRF